MPDSPNPLHNSDYLPPADGIYPTTLDGDTHRGRQWRDRARSIDVNALIPPPADDGRFDWDEIVSLIESMSDDPNPNGNPEYTVEGDYFFTQRDLRYVRDVQDSTPPPRPEDTPDYTQRTRENVQYRVYGLIAWQKYLVRHYTALLRVVLFAWRPGRTGADRVADEWTMYTLPGSWQRVNARLRLREEDKARVETNGAVMDAGRRMDAILSAWQSQHKLVAPYETSTVEGNRFPVPKRWWIGHLETRTKVDADHASDDLPEGMRYKEAFAIAATRFRRAVGTALGYDSQPEPTLEPYP